MTSTLEHWWLKPAKETDKRARAAAAERQQQLTKPLGSLGALEDLALRFAGWQARSLPCLDTINIAIFAADHGVAESGVSAYPQIVTTQMVENFVQGGAAISVLAKDLGASFKVVNAGVRYPLISSEGVENKPVGAGTKNFVEEPAMTATQCQQALLLGASTSEACDLFIGGEMGIGNTTSAAAIVAALMQWPAEKVVGRGTGISDATLENKIAIVEMALQRHQQQLSSTFSVLQCLGGFEIAALVGAYIANAQRGVPNLIDGFISTAAWLVALRMNPTIGPWCLMSHVSAEAAHRKLLDAMEVSALLDLGLRLGEGSGAATAVPLIRASLRLHSQMATFQSADVSAN